MKKPYFKDRNALAHAIAILLEQCEEDAWDEEADEPKFKSDEFDAEARIGVRTGDKCYLITITEVTDLETAPEAIADLFTDYEGEGA